MKRQMFRLVSLAALLLPLTGCVAGWQAVKPAPYNNADARYSVKLPEGWNQIAIPGDRVVASAYGPQLQRIEVDHAQLKQAFKAQKKDATPAMDPQELADAVIAELKAQSGNQTIETLHVAPAMVGGTPGFRAELASKHTFQGDAIRYKQVVYGVTNANGLYVLRYEAPVLHYFDLGLPAFEATVASFSLL
jgi:hypothetical protein